MSKQPDALIRQKLASLRAKGEVTPALVLKDPYVLDFLGIADRYVERDLEDAILRELENFLLELGAGSSFVARQKRIQLDGDDFYMDLLFYNRKLKRLVAGQLQTRVQGPNGVLPAVAGPPRKRRREELPLGIILCAGKNTEQIKLLELGAAGIHVADYLTVLPSREVLQRKLHDAIAGARLRF